MRIGGGEQAVGEFDGVAQAEVEALAGNGVQRLCAVADPHFARGDERFAQAQREREGVARAAGGDFEAAPELGFEGAGEGVVVERKQGVGLLGRDGEYDGIRLAERQQGERAVGREAFPGAAVVRFARRGFADDGVLAVAEGGAGRLIAGCAFGMDDEARFQRTAVGKEDAHPFGERGEAFDGSGREPGGRCGLAVERAFERCGEVAVAQDVAEGRQAVVFGADQGAAEAATLRDVDFADRRFGMRRPGAERFEQLARAIGERERARVVRAGAAGAAVEQGDAPRAGREGAREGEADRAGADDEDVGIGAGVSCKRVSHAASSPRCRRRSSVCWCRPRCRRR